MTTFEVPERTFEQRMRALERANEVRIYRAKLKRKLKAGDIPFARLVDDPLCETMQVKKALIVVPKYGTVKVKKTLDRLHISPSRTMGGLSERQRRDLSELVS